MSRGAAASPCGVPEVTLQSVVLAGGRGHDGVMNPGALVQVRGAGVVPFEPGGVSCSSGLAVLTVTQELIRIEARPKWLWPLTMLLFARRRGEAAWSRRWVDAPTVFMMDTGIAMTSKDAEIPMRFGASRTKVAIIAQALESLGVRVVRVSGKRDLVAAAKGLTYR